MTTLDLLAEVEAEVLCLRAKSKTLVAALTTAREQVTALEKEVQALTKPARKKNADCRS
jgi:hypothetical protein